MPFISNEIFHDRIDQTHRSNQIGMRGMLNDPAEGIQLVVQVMLVLS